MAQVQVNFDDILFNRPPEGVGINDIIPLGQANVQALPPDALEVPAPAPPPPDPALLEEQRRLRRMTVRELRNMAYQYQLRGLRNARKDALVESIARAAIGTMPNANKPFPALPEDATREQVAAAVKAEADDYRAKLKAARLWAIERNRRNEYCSDGLNEFLRTFQLPPYDRYGGMETAKQANIRSDLPSEYKDRYFTDEGLTAFFNDRLKKHQLTLRAMGDYAIRNRHRFSKGVLNSGLAVIGLPPYEPGQTASVSVGLNWSVPANVKLSKAEMTAWRSHVEQALTGFLDTLKNHELWTVSTELGGSSVRATIADDM